MLRLNFSTFLLSNLIISAFILSSCSEEGSDGDDMIPDCSMSGLTVSVTDITAVGCETNGSFTLEASGGMAPYEFSPDGTTFSSATIIETTLGGTFTVTVRDDNGCEATTSVTVEVEPGLIELDQITQDAAAGCGTSNGTITITASGGSEPLMYSIDGGELSASSTFSNLESGDHDFRVVDATGCDVEASVYVATGVGYAQAIEGQSESIQAIFTTHCAGSGCHVGDGATKPDWSVEETANNNAASIKSRVVGGSMPPGNPAAFTQEHVDLITCWADDITNRN